MSLNIFLSSCLGSAATSVYCAEFGRLAKLCRTENLRLVSAPESADLILVVDIYEEGLYAGLRQNWIWQKWPAKSFAYCEVDSPPDFLHGLHSSASKARSGSGRFQAKCGSCAGRIGTGCYKINSKNMMPPRSTLRVSLPPEGAFIALRAAGRAMP